MKDPVEWLKRNYRLLSVTRPSMRKRGKGKMRDHKLRRVMGIQRQHPAASVSVACPHCQGIITGPWVFAHIVWTCPHCAGRWALTGAGVIEAREGGKNGR